MLYMKTGIIIYSIIALIIGAIIGAVFFSEKEIVDNTDNSKFEECQENLNECLSDTNTQSPNPLKNLVVI